MKSLKIYSRIIVGLCTLIMIPSLFISVWQIQLEAPQYPEGLKMEIWAHKIAGDIDKINGLNHYIGMAQIKEENFPEFIVMPWLIISMIILGLLTALIGKRPLLWITSCYLIFCGIWGTFDFWRWEYHYGHTLDPHAAIKIPGMAYQPPLFGWKQLLNFTAGSFPDIGGWLIIGPALIIVIMLIIELALKKKNVKTQQSIQTAEISPRIAAVAIFFTTLLASCSTQPVALDFGKDECSFCKMTVIDKKFGAEVISPKGKIFKFDSGECMFRFLNGEKEFKASQYLIVNYEDPGSLVDAEKAFYLMGGNINSPMGGKLAGFKTREAAEKFQKDTRADLLLWNKIKEINF